VRGRVGVSGLRRWGRLLRGLRHFGHVTSSIIVTHHIVRWSAHPEIPFRAAKGMRNISSHDYDRVDADVVWVALESDVPRFAAMVAALLER
jgi:uncharacterized protein with HEPN domain